MTKGNFKKIGMVLHELGICRGTLRRWEKKGLVKSARDHAGTRYYSTEEVEKLKDLLQPK